MLPNAKTENGLPARTILFDSWYAGADNLKLIGRLGMLFVTTLKSNHRVSLTSESGYIHLQELVSSTEQLVHGLSITLKELRFRVINPCTPCNTLCLTTIYGLNYAAHTPLFQTLKAKVLIIKLPRALLNALTTFLLMLLDA